MHPSHRFIKLRYAHGADIDQIVEEVSSIMHLPNMNIRTELKVLNAIGDVKRPAGINKLAIMDGEDGKREYPEWDSWKQFHGLTNLLTVAGSLLVEASVDIWMSSTVREVVCGSLLVSRPVGDVVKHVHQLDAELSYISEKDIETFELIFWDFTGFGHMDKISWLGSCTSTLLALTAVTSGLSALLYRLGLGKLNVPREEMLESMENTLFLRFESERVQPGSMSVPQLTQLTGAIFDTIRFRDQYTSKDSIDALSVLTGAGISIAEGELHPSLEDLVSLVDKNDIYQTLDLIDEAIEAGKVDKNLRPKLRNMALAGKDITSVVGEGVLKIANSVINVAVEHKGEVNDEENFSDRFDWGG